MNKINANYAGKPGMYIGLRNDGKIGLIDTNRFTADAHSDSVREWDSMASEQAKDNNPIAHSQSGKTVSPVTTQKTPRDSNVVALQESLIAGGFNPGKVDGIMGPKTLAAVNARDNALKQPEETVMKQRPEVVEFNKPTQGLASVMVEREVPDWARGTIFEHTGQY